MRADEAGIPPVAAGPGLPVPQQLSGGILFAGVPNFGSWEARLARDKWFHLDVPRHLNHFTIPALLRMLSSADLEVKSCSYFAPEYDSFSFVQSRMRRSMTSTAAG